MRNANAKNTTGFSLGDVKDSFDFLVKIEMPDGVDGKGNPRFLTKKMMCQFKYLDEEEVDEISEFLSQEDWEDDWEGDDDNEQNDNDDSAEEKKNNRYFARKVLKGWKKDQFTDYDGTSLDVTPENIEKLLNIPYACIGILKAFRNSRAGKNSQRGN